MNYAAEYGKNYHPRYPERRYDQRPIYPISGQGTRMRGTEQTAVCICIAVVFIILFLVALLVGVILLLSGVPETSSGNNTVTDAPTVTGFVPDISRVPNSQDIILVQSYFKLRLTCFDDLQDQSSGRYSLYKVTIESEIDRIISASNLNLVHNGTNVQFFEKCNTSDVDTTGVFIQTMIYANLPIDTTNEVTAFNTAVSMVREVLELAASDGILVNLRVDGDSVTSVGVEVLRSGDTAPTGTLSITCQDTVTLNLLPLQSTVWLSLSDYVHVTSGSAATLTFDPFLSPDLFSAGTRMITGVATDADGNIARCQFQLQISSDICGTTSPQARIVGGSDVTSGTNPWMASMQKDDQLVCGAFLVSDEWLVTAAHCQSYLSNNIARDKITLGNTLLSSQTANTQERDVTMFIPHPSYTGTDSAPGPHDIGLIKLNSPVTFTTYVRPLCLSVTEQESTTYSECYVSGWGRDSSFGTPQDSLQTVQVDVFNYADCSSMFPAVNALLDVDYTLCAGVAEGGKDSCAGDSGGPLSCKEGSRWTAVGIVSAGLNGLCGVAGEPGIYTRISKYVDFVEAFIGAGIQVLSTSISRTITSPDFPTGYPKNAIQGWRFARQDGTQFRITYAAFILDSGDTLTIGSGLDPSDESSILITYTVGDNPSRDTLTNQNLWFRFISNDNVGLNENGFSLTIDVI